MVAMKYDSKTSYTWPKTDDAVDPDEVCNSEEPFYKNPLILLDFHSSRDIIYRYLKIIQYHNKGIQNFCVVICKKTSIPEKEFDASWNICFVPHTRCF